MDRHSQLFSWFLHADEALLKLWEMDVDDAFMDIMERFMSWDSSATGGPGGRPLSVGSAYGSLSGSRRGSRSRSGSPGGRSSSAERLAALMKPTGRQRQRSISPPSTAPAGAGRGGTGAAPGTAPGGATRGRSPATRDGRAGTAPLPAGSAAVRHAYYKRTQQQFRTGDQLWGLTKSMVRRAVDPESEHESDGSPSRPRTAISMALPSLPAPFMMGVPIEKLGGMLELPSVTSTVSSQLWHPAPEVLQTLKHEDRERREREVARAIQTHK